jgi:large subunit ribosomal protein L14e
MAADITASHWRHVEVGRVVLIQGDTPYAGRLAVIVEIINHKRVRFDLLVTVILGTGAIDSVSRY